MRHTIILHTDGTREFRKGISVEGTDKAETISHPYIKDYQVKEIVINITEGNKNKVQELLKLYS